MDSSRQRLQPESKSNPPHLGAGRQRLQRSPGVALGAAARELPLDGGLLGRLYRNFTETVREVQGFVMRTSERYRRRSSGNLSLCLRVRPRRALAACARGLHS